MKNPFKRGKQEENAQLAHEEDHVIEENPGQSADKLFYNEISQALEPALQLNYKQSYEHPQEQEDKTIPPVLRDVRVLAERYRLLFKDMQDLKRAYDESLQDEQRRKEVFIRDIEAEHIMQKKHMDNNHQLQMRSLKGRHREAMGRLQYQHNKKSEETQRLQEERADIQNRYEAEKRALNGDFENSKAELKQTHDKCIEQLKAENSQLRIDCDEEKAELVKNHAEAMKQLKEKSEILIEKLEKDHALETDRLKRDIQSRNKAFVSRDTFTPVTDGRLKSTFFEIVREVDNISRLKWKFNNSGWSDDIQVQITDNPKRLQKQILQDTIWSIFFKFIFCSPFRIFGSEGMVLETQWNDAFGKYHGGKNEYFTWPEANFGAEKWRYETMRACQETLTTPTSAYDPRTKVREAYNKSLDTIYQDIQSAFNMVSDLDESTTSSIRALIEKAAKTWVLFGTQRYRVVVVMQDLKTEIESKGKKDAQTKSVELVIRPELRRIGDSDGGSLEKDQVVAGCEGEAKRIMHGAS